MRAFLSKLFFIFTPNFWFTEGSANRLGIFRIFFGSYLILFYVISYPNWERFYGPLGILPLAISLGPEEHVAFSLFSVSSSSSYQWFLFYSGLLSAILFTIGLFFRPASIWLLILSLSMLHRAPMLVNGQDQVAILFLFISSFAPLSEAASVKRLLARKRGLKLSDKFPLWTQTLIQVAMCIIYLSAGPTKCFDSSSWCDGTAFYYVSMSDRWFRYPQVEFFHSLVLSRMITWGTLTLETIFAFLVWVPAFRTPLTISMIILHLGMMFLMAPAVFLFNLVMIAGLIVFLFPTHNANHEVVMSKLSLERFSLGVRPNRENFS